MILEKEQINRYLRHIVMPEISGPGQKKLLESSIFIYGECVKTTAPLIYYLTASGIGNIFCYFENNYGCEILFHNINDLNSDVKIVLMDKNSPMADRPISPDNKCFELNIITGQPGFITNNQDVLLSLKNENTFIPTIIALNNEWKSIIQTFNNEWKSLAKTFNNHNKIDYFLDALANSPGFVKSNQESDEYDEDGCILSSCFMGAITAIEAIKLCLNIGKPLTDALYCDLLFMEFLNVPHKEVSTYINKLLSCEYTPISIIPDTNGKLPMCKKLSQSKVLIVGTGGLGSPAAYALCMAGIGTIGLIDYDTVEISNLNRQILHSASRIGMSKVESASHFLKEMNPDMNIITYNTSFNKDNAIEIISGYDVIIDGVDNFSARYLLNDACYFTKKPMMESGVLRFDGLNMAIIPDVTPCYRCLFPNIPKAGSIPSCSESGVLGPVPGVMGFIEAAEVVKLLTGKGNLLMNRILYFDALDMDFSIPHLEKNLECPLCGENPSIEELGIYEFVCDFK